MIELQMSNNIGTELEPFVDAIPDPQLREKFMGAIASIEQRYGCIHKAKSMELENAEDLVAVIAASRDASIPVIYHFGENGTSYLLVWIVIHDVYDFRGVPLVVYARANGSKFPKYLIYDQGKDRVRPADKSSDRSIDISFRVVRIKSLPDFLKVS